MIVLQRKPQGVTKALESVRRMSRWLIRLMLIASHGKQFQSSAQTTCHCCLSGVKTLRWSVTIPEETQLPKSRLAVNGRSAPGRSPSPLLFAIYINDLLVEFEDNTLVSAYADDLVIARNKDMIITSLQPEVDKVVAWSAKARLTLNSSKCETAFFSLDCAHAAWQPKITGTGKRMFCNPIAIFLGDKYGRQLTFGVHVRKLDRCPAAITSSKL